MMTQINAMSFTEPCSMGGGGGAEGINVLQVFIWY